MARFTVSLLLLSASLAFAQSNPANNIQALTIANQAITAMTGGASVGDVTLTGNVISVAGSDRQSGTATLSAKGLSESRTVFNLSGNSLTEVRSKLGASPQGGWSRGASAQKALASHNAQTDAVWFFPALSSLAATRAGLEVFLVTLERLRGLLIIALLWILLMLVARESRNQKNGKAAQRHRESFCRREQTLGAMRYVFSLVSKRPSWSVPDLRLSVLWTVAI